MLVVNHCLNQLKLRFFQWSLVALEAAIYWLEFSVRQYREYSKYIAHLS